VLPFSPVAPDTQVRSPGLHVGQVIQDMLWTLNRKKYGSAVTEQTRMLWESGFLWEDALSHVLARRLTRGREGVIVQREIQHRGLWMTPDGINLLEDRGEEYKFTRYSANHEFDSATFRHWHWQAMAYLDAWQMNTCDFYVLFINGNYSHAADAGPLARHYVVEYSDREIADNMRMILNHAKGMKR